MANMMEYDDKMDMDYKWLRWLELVLRILWYIDVLSYVDVYA